MLRLIKTFNEIKAIFTSFFIRKYMTLLAKIKTTFSRRYAKNGEYLESKVLESLISYTKRRE